MDTKQAIQKEFIKLYAEKDYNCLTIKELCMQIPIARTTFYTYYQNLDEVKADMEAYLLNGFHDIIKGFNEDIAFVDLHDFLRYSMAYIRNNWDFFYAFLIMQPNMRFIESWKESIKKHFLMHYPNTKNGVNHELILDMVASSAIQCYCYWMKHPNDVNDEKLFDMVQSIIYSMIHTMR